MVNASVLIHTRTYKAGFVPGFAVRPCDFSDSETAQAMEYILAATSGIDMLEGNRQIVFSINNKTVVGMVGFLKEFCKPFADKDTECKRFFVDEKRRKIFAFIGCVFHRNEGPAGNIDNKKAYELFTKYMSCVWEKELVETQKADYNEVLPSSIAFENFELPEKFESNKTIYFVNNDQYNQLVFESCSESGKSFCSNNADYKKILDSKYDYISTSHSTYERIKTSAEAVNRPAPAGPSPSFPVATIVEEPPKEEREKPSILLDRLHEQIKDTARRVPDKIRSLGWSIEMDIETGKKYLKIPLN